MPSCWLGEDWFATFKPREQEAKLGHSVRDVLTCPNNKEFTLCLEPALLKKRFSGSLKPLSTA